VEQVWTHSTTGVKGWVVNKQERAQALYDLLEAKAAEQGFDLIDVEVKGQASRPIVTVFLDKDGGVYIEDLTAANEWIDRALDASNSIETSYTLEVSSPGGRQKRGSKTE
jgi:ribosome maturation factor RimP